jgi:hypothetical protein
MVRFAPLAVLMPMTAPAGPFRMIGPRHAFAPEPPSKAIGVPSAATAPEPVPGEAALRAKVSTACDEPLSRKVAPAVTEVSFVLTTLSPAPRPVELRTSRMP